MAAEIRVEQEGDRWRGRIIRRPDVKVYGRSAAEARRKAIAKRKYLGTCGAKTQLFDGQRCELVKDHRARRGARRNDHRAGSMMWFTLSEAEMEREEPVEMPVARARRENNEPKAGAPARRLPTKRARES